MLYLVPALSIACFLLSVVIIPFKIGILYSKLRFLIAFITVDEIYSSCFVSPFITQPTAIIISGLVLVFFANLSNISLIQKGNSNVPGAFIIARLFFVLKIGYL